MSQREPNLALQNAIARIEFICDESGGRSQYFGHGGSGYHASVTHYFESSTEVPLGGAVQPGSEEDLAKIVKVIADTRVKFAIKCGGHSTNPGFSSTTGIQIYLTRLNKIVVDKGNKLVRAGAGCLFEELYQKLHKYDLNIVGGSGLAGVGLSGWMLGGGYSAKTSQYGLGVDNLKAVRLVLPNGEVKVAGEKEGGEKENEDLFFAVKGGGNNFGIVTEFTLIAHDQPEGTYYDETFAYNDARCFDAVKAAIWEIIEQQDKQTNIEAAFRHYSVPGTTTPEVTLTVHCVYDGPRTGKNPFAELKKIKRLEVEGKCSDSPPGNGDATPTKTTTTSETRTQETDSPAVISANPLHNYNVTYDHLIDRDTLTLALAPSWSHKTDSYIYADLRRSYLNGTYDSLGGVPNYLLFTTSLGEPQARVERTQSLSLKPPPPKRERPKHPMTGIGQFPRGRWGNVMVDEFTKGIIQEIQDQSDKVAENMRQHGGTHVKIGLWPFAKTMFDKATDSAFPHKKDKPNCPIIIYFTWEGKQNDEHWINTMKTTIDDLRKKVNEERAKINPEILALPYFINTALAEAIQTAVEQLYGEENLQRLKDIRKNRDPTGVMDLTGGFKIPRAA